MFKSRILQADKVSDRDIFNYISQQMLKQGVKSQEQWYDEEADIVEDGDSCRYFGYDLRTETDLRCAVGWIMNREIFEKYQDLLGGELEGNGITNTEPLEVVILSNENWQFTKESWVMLSIMQRIHDNANEADWSEIFLNMSYLFDSNGTFCPNYVQKDSYGNSVNHEALYEDVQYVTEKSDDEDCVHFVDFEELGISFKIPHHNPNVVSKISDTILGPSDEFNSCIDSKAIGLNILDAEDQQTADTSAMNFLDLMDAVRIKNQEKELVPNAGE